MLTNYENFLDYTDCYNNEVSVLYSLQNDCFIIVDLENEYIRVYDELFDVIERIIVDMDHIDEIMSGFESEIIDTLKAGENLVSLIRKTSFYGVECFINQVNPGAKITCGIE